MIDPIEALQAPQAIEYRAQQLQANGNLDGCTTTVLRTHGTGAGRRYHIYEHST